MDEAFNDPRFGHIMSDPKFKKPPKFQRKVKIDKRFQRMFNDKNFQVKYTVDKRGKPVNQSSVENYGKFYALSDDDDSDSDDTENNTDNQSSDSSVEEQKTVKQVDKTKKLKLKSSLRENKKILVKSKKDSNKMKDCEQNLEENSKNKSKTKKKGLVEDETVDDAGNNDFDEDEEEEEDDEREDKEEEDSDYDNDRETEETSDESEDDIPKEVKEEALKKVSQKRKLPQEVKDKLHDMSVDYARGMGVLSDSSSSDDSSEDDAAADEEEDLEHDWGELDKDAERTDSATSRLAICNMDWDRIRAVDLMVLCSSFLPPGGVIESVSIYISEFGRKRMDEEEVRGPIEIVEQKRLESEIDLENREEEDEEGDKYQMEQLRKYQLLRLKYYYAIVVCDSADTASTLYDECDGLEYESSATRVDLRFVPDDVTFDEEPRDVCTKLPDVKKYQPRLFLNTALQQGKVECTWDETDPERVKLAQKLHQLKGGDNIDDKELQMFLASSEEEVEQNEEHEAGKEVTNGDGKDSDDSNSEESDISDNDGKVKKNSIDKYRSLLAKIQEEDEKKKNRDVEMEITWGVGLKEKAQKMVDKKLKENIQMTPFEKMIEKKREKKKLKKKERIKRNGEDSTNDDIDEDSSDDDIPDGIDMNDEYFREELEGFAPKKSKNKKKKDKQKSDSDDGEDDEETKRNANELDLLFMDENGGETQKKHFNLKKIMENEDDSKKKKKRKGRKQLIKKNKKKVEAPATYVEDDFKINVADERFSALYSSHHFNIDPADAHYKKTKGMEAFIHEKLSRKDKDERSGSSSLGKKTRDNVKSSNKDGLHSNPTKKQKLDSTSDLSQIVNSIKRNTQFSKTKTKS